MLIPSLLVVCTYTIHKLKVLHCGVFILQDEQILKDPVLTDKEYLHRLRADFVNDLNTIVALSTHGPMYVVTFNSFVAPKCR